MVPITAPAPLIDETTNVDSRRPDGGFVGNSVRLPGGRFWPILPVQGGSTNDLRVLHPGKRVALTHSDASSMTARCDPLP